MKVLDFIKENGKYLFVYNKNGICAKYEVNGKVINVNGKDIKLCKPFENIVQFEHFCVETNLF